MKRPKTAQLLLICIFLLAHFTFGQAGKIKVKDLPGQYKRWITEEVNYIITPIEKDVFLRLQTDHERDLFIEAFWKQRDPTVGTEINEFREEHYRRLNHANRRFIGSGRAGWQSDRGRVYILLGEPKDVRLFHGSDAYYSSEAWYYQGVQGYGLPQAFTLLFYQKGRVGDYRIYDPTVDGPWSLMSNYKGDQGNYHDSYYVLDDIEPELAKLSVSLIPGESLVNIPSMASTVLLQNINEVAVKKVKDKYAEKFIQYKDIVEVEYSANYMESETQVQVIQSSSGIHFVHFSIEPQNLSMSSYERKIFTNLEFNGIITDKQGNMIFQFEKSIPLNFSEEQFEQMKHRPFSFSDKFPLVPGEYQFSLIVKNSVSKEFTTLEKEINIIPQKTFTQISPLLLGFNAVQVSSQNDLAKPFVVENVQLYSQARNSFLSKDGLYVFFQIFALPPEMREKVSVQYVIFREDEPFSSIIHPLSKYPSDLNIIEMFPLEKFRPGYYKVEVSLLDETKTEMASEREYFEVSPAMSIPRPWVIAKSLIESGEAHVDYILGRQLMSKKDYTNAQSWLEKAHHTEPGYIQYGLYLAQAYFHLKKYNEALNTLQPFIEQGKNEYDFSFLLAKIYQELAEYDKAIEIFDRAVSRFGLNVNLLNGLGECYFRLGNTNEALAALEKSLEIDPNQDEVKKLIDTIRK